MNPYRHRNKLDAQGLIDCDIVECCKIEVAVYDDLSTFER